MHITALYSGILGLILIYLSYLVVGNRKKQNVGIGDGDNKELSRAIRVHANFSEYVPVALILLAVFESNQGNSMFVHIAGIALVVARILHAHGLGKTIKQSFGRFAGVLVTWIVISGLSGLNIYHFVVSSQLS